MHFIVGTEGNKMRDRNFREFITKMEYEAKGQLHHPVLRQIRLYEIIAFEEGREQIYSQLKSEISPKWQGKINKITKWIKKIFPFIDNDPPDFDKIEANDSKKGNTSLPKIVVLGEKEDKYKKDDKEVELL